MAVKKAEKAEKTEEKASSKSKKEKYFYGLGRRKSSVAQVRVYESEKATEADFVINGKKLKDYFALVSLQNSVAAPFKAVGLVGKTTMTVLVKGGGTTGQAEAIRLGISRALIEMNAEFKKTLKDLGYLTRDSREVERKKPGLKKARRAPQWAKR